MAKEVDRWKEGMGERKEERDLKGDLSLELPKLLANADVLNVGCFELQGKQLILSA